jgi:2-phosphosulfolactate phosphatase
VAAVELAGRAAFTQRQYDIRFDWGESGVRALAVETKVLVVVDVLSFSTCVAVACARGATVLPYPWKDERVTEYARRRGAVVAEPRDAGNASWSLSPETLTRIPSGTRLVLPSPNGSSLCLSASAAGSVLAGCLRNASAVAARVATIGGPIAVIAAGERWEDGSLRPALEDLIGAGAVIARLRGTLSPEAEAAVAACERVAARLHDAIRDCTSGRELVERGFERDVRLAAELDASPAAPVLQDREFRGA